MPNNQSKSKRFFVFLAIAFVVLVVASLGARVYLANKGEKSEKGTQELVGLQFYQFSQARNLSAVPLVNLNGDEKPFSEHLSGWRLVNTGYMFCPDICPINLSLLNTLKTEWDQQENTQALEILHLTFDPERDTPALLKQYLEYMNPKFYGLTGEIENIRTLTKQLNMVFIHEKPDERGNYFISHSDSMALINPEGQYVGLFKGPYQVATMKRALNIIINGTKY